MTQFRHRSTFQVIRSACSRAADAHPDTRQENSGSYLNLWPKAEPLPSGPALIGSRLKPILGERIMSQREEVHELAAIEDSEHPDRSIKCVDCNENFIWTSGEQAFFHDKGLKNEPKRCKPCKQAKNERLAAITAAQSSGVRQRVEVSVQCAQCGQQTTVPFYPSQGRPVYCRACFLAGRGNETSASA